MDIQTVIVFTLLLCWTKEYGLLAVQSKGVKPEVGKEAISLARCYSSCYDKYGYLPDHFDAGGYYEIAEEFCPNKMCADCQVPCNKTFNSYEDCKHSCGESLACGESCNSTTNDAADHSYQKIDLFISRPKVLCMNIGSSCEPGAVKLYLTWTAARHPVYDLVVFAIEMRFKSRHDNPASPWVSVKPIPSTFAKIEGLSCNTLYQFRVTPVSTEGHYGQPRLSDWILTYSVNTSLRPPSWLRVKDRPMIDQKPSITLEWDNGIDSSCNFKLFWFGRVVNQAEIKAPWKFQYNLTGLYFGTNYTINLHSSDENFLHTSKEKLTRVVETPECLQSTSFNHTVCAPLKPRNVTLEILTSDHRNPDVKYINVSLHWEPPVGTHNGRDIIHYFLTYRKVPPVYNAKNIRPHKAAIVIDPNVNSVIIQNIHNHNLYVFTLAAESHGGRGEDTQLSDYFGLRNYVNESQNTSLVTETFTPGPLTVPELVAVVIVPLLLILVILLVVLKLMRRKIRQQNLSSRHLGPVEEMNPIYEGMPLFSDTGGEKHVADSYEIDYSCLDFISVIGEGAFGKVVKAEFYQRPSDRGRKVGRVVAVKMLKEFYTGDESRNFMLEIQAMKNLGSHPYIIGIIGCCLTGPKRCLVMDYCALGDLRNYLRKHREKLMCNMSSSYGVMTKGDCSFQDNLLGLDSCGSRSTETTDSQERQDEPEITEAQLLSYARQITMGMEFLEQKKFIHRDLAARNVLLYDKRHIKISDFGLTRDVYETNVYQPTSARKLPYKWMAIESLFSQRFTIKSDVWSFGIVLWEIVTLGGSPYPSIPLKDLYGLLKEGYRNERPENCSKQVYDIMLACWHPNPNSRPTFSRLRLEIEKLLEETKSYIDLSVEVSGDYYNESNPSSQTECQAQENASNGKNTENNQVDDVTNPGKKKLVVDIHDEPKCCEQCLSESDADTCLLPKATVENQDFEQFSIDPGMYCLFRQNTGKLWSKSDRQLEKRPSSHSNRSLQASMLQHNKHSFKQSIKSLFDRVGIKHFASTPKTRRRSVSLTDDKSTPNLNSKREFRSSVTVL